MTRRLYRMLLWFTLISMPALAQTSASLQTAETHIEVQAGPHAPRLVALRNRDMTWRNALDELPIRSVEIANQSIPLEWNYNSAESRVDANVVRYVYDSNSPRLRLIWQWEVRSAHGPIEHQISIENRDDHELWLPVQRSFVFGWQIARDVQLEQFYVEKGADTPSSTGTHLVTVPNGYAWEGTSSTYAQPRPGESREVIPYFLVENTAAGQPGWYVGIEFSGRTHLTLARTGVSLRGEAGLNPNPGPFRTRLKPEETFETPRIFLGAARGGPDVVGNTLHRWVREVLGNGETWRDPHYPFLVNNSWGGGMNVDEGVARRMIHDSSDLGFEMFHVDAGWFRGVGDWYPDMKKFPRGLGPIADEAHARGMKFGLWADWAQAGIDAGPGALNARDPKVQSWLASKLPDDWKPEEFKGQTIDIGVPEAKAWAMQETDRIVNAYKLDMLEHDGYLVAKGCVANDHPHAQPDPYNRCTYRDSGFLFELSSNSSDVSYHAVQAYYDIQSNLRRKHSGLLLEICNDGGRMVDFGTAAHGDYFSITDTYDPLSNRRAFYDTSFVLPPAMLEAYVERWPTATIENFRYMLRSGMMGWLSVMIDTSSWNSEQHAVAKEELRLYKSQLRPLIRDADLYHISARPDGLHWDGVEYFDNKTGHGAVYAFRGSSPSEPQHSFALQGLNPSSQYELRFHDHSGADQIVSGRELMSKGIEVRLTVANSSDIILLEEQPSKAHGSGVSQSR